MEDKVVETVQKIQSNDKQIIKLLEHALLVQSSIKNGYFIKEPEHKLSSPGFVYHEIRRVIDSLTEANNLLAQTIFPKNSQISKKSKFHNFSNFLILEDDNSSGSLIEYRIEQELSQLKTIMSYEQDFKGEFMTSSEAIQSELDRLTDQGLDEGRAGEGSDLPEHLFTKLADTHAKLTSFYETLKTSPYLVFDKLNTQLKTLKK